MSIWLEVFSGVSDKHELDQWALKPPAPVEPAEPVLDAPEDVEPEPIA
jgi:hypothetical protein